MRDYGKVHTSFWTSLNIRSMSEDGRALAMYLLTCPHGTIAGVFRLPDGYACEDLQWSPERVKEGFDELFRNGFANRCETTKWVWIVKHFDWNPPENPNQKKAAYKVAAQVPEECGWKPDFMRDCGVFFGVEIPIIPNPSGTLPEPFLNQEQEQEQEQDLKASCGGPASCPPPPATIPKPRFDFVSGQFTDLADSLIAGWAEAYPAVDVRQEIAKAAAWLMSNPKNRKSDYPRFLNNWLSRAQDSARPVQGRQQRPDKFDPVAYVNRNRISKQRGDHADIFATTANIIDITP